VNERRARRFWLGFIAAFFASQAVLWTWAIFTVSADTSHAIVRDYDARALDWDAQRARMDASAALGWHAAIELDRTQLTVRITDRDHRPLAGATPSVTMFHKAEAARRQEPALHEIEPGVWRASVDLRRAGWWFVELETTRGPDRFAITNTVAVN
jgi:nitrogen fixation protein FixH